MKKPKLKPKFKTRKIMVRMQDIWKGAKIIGKGWHKKNEDDCFNYYMVSIYEKI